MSDALIAKTDPFVSYVNGTFTLDEAAAQSKLSSAELASVKSTIEQTRSEVSRIKPGQGDVRRDTDRGPVVEPEFADRFQEGRNGIEFHWWGQRIFLSKSAIQNVGAGVSIAGVWIPHKVVAAVVAALGIVIGRAPGGVVFDTNPATWVLSGAPKIWNVHFQ